MSDPEPDPEPLQLPKIPWQIRLRYHARQAWGRLRGWREKAESFELEDQPMSGCLHFFQAYAWIMLPLLLGLFFGAHANQWDRVNWSNSSSWPLPWKLVVAAWDGGSGLWGLIILPISMPFMSFVAPGWLGLPNVLALVVWYGINLHGTPKYGYWVPGMTALQGWVMLFFPERHPDLAPCLVMGCVTIACGIWAWYWGWWRPQQQLKLVDLERALRRAEMEAELAAGVEQSDENQEE